MLPQGATPWPEVDRALARLMSTYWANFAKTGDPNGPGLPQWPEYNSELGAEVMHFNADSKASPDQDQARYRFISHWTAPKQ
jgi:para-nitrobenzyl esterase